MTSEYDPDTGARYFKVGEGDVSSTRHFGEMVAVDLDTAGEVVGVELLAPLPGAPTLAIEAYLAPVVAAYPNVEAALRAAVWNAGMESQAMPLADWLREVGPGEPPEPSEHTETDHRPFVATLNITFDLDENEIDDLFDRVHDAVAAVVDPHGPDEPCVRLFSFGGSTVPYDDWVAKLDAELAGVADRAGLSDDAHER